MNPPLPPSSATGERRRIGVTAPTAWNSPGAIPTVPIPTNPVAHEGNIRLGDLFTGRRFADRQPAQRDAPAMEDFTERLGLAVNLSWHGASKALCVKSGVSN